MLSVVTTWTRAGLSMPRHSAAPYTVCMHAAPDHVGNFCLQHIILGDCSYTSGVHPKTTPVFSSTLMCCAIKSKDRALGREEE